MAELCTNLEQGVAGRGGIRLGSEPGTVRSANDTATRAPGEEASAEAATDDRARSAQELASARRRALLDNLRSDYQLHGRRLLTRTFIAMAVYRFGAWATEQPRAVERPASKVYGWLDKVSRVLTGVHMDRGVTLGDEFHIIHAEGNISIHPQTVIGDRVGIMHNVTIGEGATGGGAAIIEDDVFIGVGAVIIGKVRIGKGAHIAANTLVLADVPPNSVAIGVPARTYPRLGAIRKPAR